MGENRHFRIIEKAIKFIKENFDSNLKLAEISEHVGMSDYHFQRLFTKWVGISPKQYSQYLLKERALIELNKEQSLLVSSLALGLSSPSRFHDLVVKTIAMSPFEVRQSCDAAYEPRRASQSQRLPPLFSKHVAAALQTNDVDALRHCAGLWTALAKETTKTSPTCSLLSGICFPRHVAHPHHSLALVYRPPTVPALPTSVSAMPVSACAAASPPGLWPPWLRAR